MSKIVIIGNSAAGFSCLKTLIDSGAPHQLTVVTDEAYPAYRRTELAQYLAGTRREEDLFLCTAQFYREKGVTFLPQARVQRLDTKKNRLILKDNTKIDYDVAVAAPGVKVDLPDIPGKSKEGVVAWGQLDGAKELRQLLIVGKAVCVIGSFPEVRELAEVLAAAQKEVKVVSRDVPPEYVPVDGIEVIAGTDIAECIGEGAELQAVKLSSGKAIGVVAAVFTGPHKPSTEFLKEAAVAMKDGYVIVDEAHRASAPAVFACGAAATDTQGNIKEKSWDEAAAEGVGAARSILSNQ